MMGDDEMIKVIHFANGTTGRYEIMKYRDTQFPGVVFYFVNRDNKLIGVKMESNRWVEKV